MQKLVRAAWDETTQTVVTLLIDDNHAVLQSAHEYGIRYLLTLLQPDSRREARAGLYFPAILHFDEIMPELEDLDV